MIRKEKLIVETKPAERKLRFDKEVINIDFN